MTRKLITIILLLTFALPSYAVKKKLICLLEVAKGSCWKNYDVTIKIVNLTKHKIKRTLKLPPATKDSKSVFSKKMEFPCETLDTFSLFATFKPAIWEENIGKDKEYQSIKLWPVPGIIQEDTQKWLIQICFPDAFHSIPNPPDYTGQCDCKFTIKPPKEGY